MLRSEIDKVGGGYRGFVRAIRNRPEWTWHFYLRSCKALADGILGARVSNRNALSIFCLEVVLMKRCRKWDWRVCTPEGDVVTEGADGGRRVAKYGVERALFQLLQSPPYRSPRSSTPPRP